jgi:hypothetical protein
MEEGLRDLAGKSLWFLHHLTKGTILAFNMLLNRRRPANGRKNGVAVEFSLYQTLKASPHLRRWVLHLAIPQITLERFLKGTLEPQFIPSKPDANSSLNF